MPREPTKTSTTCREHKPRSPVLWDLQEALLFIMSRRCTPEKPKQPTQQSKLGGWKVNFIRYMKTVLNPRAMSHFGRMSALARAGCHGEESIMSTTTAPGSTGTLGSDNGPPGPLWG